jgi:hypothetical protein
VTPTALDKGRRSPRKLLRASSLGCSAEAVDDELKAQRTAIRSACHQTE